MEQPYNSNTNPPMGGTPPKNWLVESILVTIFCCLPFGIVGIINASNVNSRVAVGDYAGAMEASRTAGKWTKIGFYVGIAQYVLALIFVFLFGGLAMLGGMSNQ